MSFALATPHSLADVSSPSSGTITVILKDSCGWPTLARTVTTRRSLPDAATQPTSTDKIFIGAPQRHDTSSGPLIIPAAFSGSGVSQIIEHLRANGGAIAEPVGDLTAGTMRGPTRLTRRGSIPGRAARVLISPRKATCQVPASGLSAFGPRSPARAKDPNRERPRRQGPGPPASLGPRGCYPKQDALR